MAYQKETANTVEQMFDKFLSFCCIYGGFTRLTNTDTGFMRISKGNVTYLFEKVSRGITDYYEKGKAIRLSMVVGDTTAPKYTYVALWTFDVPFVAIDMFANSNDCYLVIELSPGVFTQIGIGKVKDITGEVVGGWFLQANGMTARLSHDSKEYKNCLTYCKNRSSFFTYATLDYTRPDDVNSSYVHDNGKFYETQLLNTTYFCGHNNPITDNLIKRTPASNILRHTSPPLYYVDYNVAEERRYIKGYVYGCRPCTMNLIKPRDVIMDNWMAFPLTSVNNNDQLYPSCSGRGYLFYMGD